MRGLNEEPAASRLTVTSTPTLPPKGSAQRTSDASPSHSLWLDVRLTLRLLPLAVRCFLEPATILDAGRSPSKAVGSAVLMLPHCGS